MSIEETEENWAVIEVKFEATPVDQVGKVEALNEVLRSLFELSRPTCRSQVAWDNGTLTYVYEVGVQLRPPSEAWFPVVTEALLGVGLIDNESCVRVV